MGKMIKYQENGGDIIRKVEIDLTEATSQGRQDLKRGITKYLETVTKECRDIFRFEGQNKFVYKTEVLIPKTSNDRVNLLTVLGNPAVHSVAEGMLFSYEGTGLERKWREHRFWRALRNDEILRFYHNLGNPTCENIREINARKRDWLLSGDYQSEFNIFILPYFSFPTPPSRECSGVAGIRKMVGGEIFKEMKKSEFQQFLSIVSCNKIENIICFQKSDASKEILKRTENEQIGNIIVDESNYEVYKIDIASKRVTLYYAGPTRLLHTNKGKEILKNIAADIKVKNKIG